MAPPKGQAAIRPYQPRQPSPPQTPRDIVITRSTEKDWENSKAAALEQEALQAKKRELEQAAEMEQETGPSEG